jgi:hypothetical protein
MHMIESYEDRLAREKAETERRMAELRAFCNQVATAMGDGWHVVTAEGDRDPHLVRASDGAEFYIGYGWREKHRLTVGAAWPKDATGKPHVPYFSEYSDNGGSSPSISFAATKTPQQAARDIERRFLPAFLPLWAKQAASVQATNKYSADKKELAHRIAWILGGTAAENPRNENDSTVRLGFRDHGIREVTFSDKEHEIHVSVVCTIEELRALAALFPKQPATAEPEDE